MLQRNDDAVLRAIIADANRELRDNVQVAVRKLVELAQDDSIDPKHQLKAIEMILVRVLGKPPDKIEIKSSAPWESAIAAALVADFIDTEAVEVPNKSKSDFAGQAGNFKKKKRKMQRAEE